MYTYINLPLGRCTGGRYTYINLPLGRCTGGRYTYINLPLGRCTVNPLKETSFKVNVCS